MLGIGVILPTLPGSTPPSGNRTRSRPWPGLCACAISPGPFAQSGLDEALSLAVGLGRVGFCSDVLDAELFACSRESERFVAASVIGHDAIDGDAEAFVVGDGGAQEGDGAAFSFVRKDGCGSDWE